MYIYVCLYLFISVWIYIDIPQATRRRRPAASRQARAGLARHRNSIRKRNICVWGGAI